MIIDHSICAVMNSLAFVYPFTSILLKKDILFIVTGTVC
jgi:hypothetical protein